MEIKPDQVWKCIYDEDEYIVIKKCNIGSISVTVHNNKSKYNNILSEQFINVFCEYLGQCLSEVFLKNISEI